MLAQLLCLGRHTITSLITTYGAQFADWTAHYDLYAKQRVDPNVLFKGIRENIEQINGNHEPLTIALDDTILRKTGQFIPGAAYRKDPLGPAFNINLVWAQRMIQFSACIPGANGEGRMVPINFVDASTPRKMRTIQIKTIERARWRKAGEMDLRLVVIRAIPRKGPRGNRAYSQPAYLICTDPSLALGDLLQSYIWRWDIEVNHRDEKTLLGVGEAQVRNPESAWSVPASAVAAYAMLQLAAIRAFGWDGKPNVIPPPQWRDPEKKRRASTLDLVNELRRELWADAIHNMNLTDFKNGKSPDAKSVKYQPNLGSALFTATA